MIFTWSSSSRVPPFPLPNRTWRKLFFPCSHWRIKTNISLPASGTELNISTWSLSSVSLLSSDKLFVTCLFGNAVGLRTLANLISSLSSWKNRHKNAAKHKRDNAILTWPRQKARILFQNCISDVLDGVITLSDRLLWRQNTFVLCR